MPKMAHTEKMDDMYMGHWTPKECPMGGCDGHLMTNSAGNEWCTKCSYHMHGGKRVDGGGGDRHGRH